MAVRPKGFIKLYRSLQDNPIWGSEPFSKGQAWVDLLLSAYHKGYDCILGNEILHVDRGQYFTSELKLAEKWKWSRKKTHAYLKLLEKLKMATTKGTRQGTMITIENYSIYQDKGTTKGTSKGTVEEQQRDNEGYTYNELEEGLKNDKETYTDLFETFWKEYPNKKAKPVALKSWDKIKNLDFDLIMVALKKQKQTTDWNKDNGQFIPMPATWINQERWNDEIKEKSKDPTLQRAELPEGISYDEL